MPANGAGSQRCGGGARTKGLAVECSFVFDFRQSCWPHHSGSQIPVVLSTCCQLCNPIGLRYSATCFAVFPELRLLTELSCSPKMPWETQLLPSRPGNGVDLRLSLSGRLLELVSASFPLTIGSKTHVFQRRKTAADHLRRSQPLSVRHWSWPTRSPPTRSGWSSLPCAWRLAGASVCTLVSSHDIALRNLGSFVNMYFVSPLEKGHPSAVVLHTCLCVSVCKCVQVCTSVKCV